MTVIINACFTKIESKIQQTQIDLGNNDLGFLASFLNIWK